VSDKEEEAAGEGAVAHRQWPWQYR